MIVLRDGISYGLFGHGWRCYSLRRGMYTAGGERVECKVSREEGSQLVLHLALVLLRDETYRSRTALTLMSDKFFIHKL
jgi:hypothetical protein